MHRAGNPDAHDALRRVPLAFLLFDCPLRAASFAALAIGIR
jgi:hypothetical protein